MVKRMHRILIGMIFLFTLLRPALGLAPVSATVDKTETFLDEPIGLSLTIENGDGNEQITLPDSQEYTIRSAGTSQETSIINGKMSSSLIYNYEVMPKKAGPAQIGSIQVVKQGKSYQTEPILIRVLTPSNRPSSFNSSNDSGTPGQASGDEVKVELKLDKTELYVDEPDVMHFKIYRRTDAKVGNAGYNMPKLPEFMAEKEQQSSDLATLNGIAYEVTDIRTVIYPSKPGTYTLGPGTLSCEVYRKSRQSGNRRRPRLPGFPDDDFFDDPFSSFFGGGMNAIPVKLSSKVATVTVKPLPPGKPASFSGTIGNYRLNVEYSDMTKLKKGDPINLIMTVEGAGHLSTVAEPTLSGAEGFKLFDSEVNLVPLEGGSSLAGKKVFKKMIVPEKAGSIRLPTVEFSFFNPLTGKYEIQRKEGPEIHVEEVKETEFNKKMIDAESTAMRNKEALKIKNEDIIYIDGTSAVLTPYSENIPWNIFFGGIGAGPALYLLILIPSYYRRRMKNDPAFRRKRTAYSGFRKNLKAIRFNVDNDRESAANLSKAMTAYFADKLNLPSGTWTTAEITSRLGSLEVPENLIKEFCEHIEHLDQVQYGMSKLGLDDWRKRMQATIRTVDQLEELKVWKS